MKTAIFALLVSFSAMASECYVRSADLVTNEVTLSKEICINSVDLKLQGYGSNMALIKYSLDGVASEKAINLTYPIELRNGKILYFVYGLESNFEGGGCGDSIQAEINANLIMNKDGSDVKLEEIKGSVSTSNDNCHSDMREVQSIDYKLI